MKNMRYEVAEEAKPQVYLLVVATLISIGLWLLSNYIPFAGLLTYPIRIFATFVHEGSHVIATLLTGNSVQSMSVAADGSGVVWSQSSGWFSQLLISSAGYIGTTAFGAGLLATLRFGYSSRAVLAVVSGLLVFMTAVFGIFAPIWNFLANVSIGDLIFTVLSGLTLAAALAAIAKFASITWANFAVAFLAVQCLANSLVDLATLMFASVNGSTQSDAANMAAATGIPAIVWVFIWMGVSVLLISLGLRLYSVSRTKSSDDSLFEN